MYSKLTIKHIKKNEMNEKIIRNKIIFSSDVCCPDLHIYFPFVNLLLRAEAKYSMSDFRASKIQI